MFNLDISHFSLGQVRLSIYRTDPVVGDRERKEGASQLFVDYTHRQEGLMVTGVSGM